MIDRIKLFASKFSVSTITVIAMAFSLLGATGVTAATYSFAKDLTVGARGVEVVALQSWLGVKPATGYFGNLTKAAVIKFQKANGITPAVGYFGPKTRVVANASVSSAPVVVNPIVTPVVVSSGDFTVSLAPSSPASSAVISGQSGADLVEYVFSNNTASPVLVTNVALQRTGISSDSLLVNVYLYNGAIRLTDAASVSSGKITFNSPSGIFTIPAGSKIVVSVKADISTSGSNGQLVSISLLSVGASAPLSIASPILGSSMSVVTASGIAQMTAVISDSVKDNANIEAGSLNHAIWSSDLNLSGNSVYFKSLALKMVGSIPTNSLQNIKMYVDGIQVGSASSMDANGVITFDISSAPYTINSSVVLEVRADVVGGSGRSFSVQLQNPSDIQVVDSNFGTGITVDFGSGSRSSGTFSVTSGSVIVTLDSSLSNTDVVTGSNNVVLSKYTFKAYGEDMKISELNVLSSSKLDNVALYANGIQIGSTQTISEVNTAKLFSGLNISLSAGSSVTVEVKGDIKAGGINLISGNSVQVSVVGTSGNTKSSFSYTSTQVPSMKIAGPSMKVVSAGVDLSMDSSFSDASIAPNQSQVKVGSFTLQTNSSEGVRVGGITVGLNGSISAGTSLSNLYIVVDGVSSTPIGQPQGVNNFSVNFSTGVNSSKNIDVYVDTSSATGTIVSSISLSGYGVNSKIKIPSGSVEGQTMTVGSGHLSTPTVGSPSTDSQLVLGGLTSKIVDFNFVSVDGVSVITDMTFNVKGPVTKLTVGGNTFSVNSNTGSSTATGLSISVPTGYEGDGINVPVLATYANIGLNGKASMSTSSVTLTSYKYSSGNINYSETSSVSSKDMLVVASKPVVSLEDSMDTIGTNSLIASVTITADAKGSVNLIALPIVISTTKAQVDGSSIQVRDTTSGSNLDISKSDSLSSSTISSATGTIGFNTTQKIAAGTSKTFYIYADTVGVDSNTDYVRVKLGDKSLFIWKDVSGNATANGSFIYNYPTNTSSISN